MDPKLTHSLSGGTTKEKFPFLETSVIFDKTPKDLRFFQTRFLENAEAFIAALDKKSAIKLFYNIDLAEQTNDPRLFKKLQDEIWEFRTRYLGLQIRMLAFWDKENTEATLVFATHGFVKKDSKVPKNEIEKAEAIRKKYFEAKAKAPVQTKPKQHNK